MKNLIKGIMFGAIAGALIWLYDYDFLLNMGGPSTPISDSIRDFFQISIYDAFKPLFILISLGIIISIPVTFAIALITKIKNKSDFL